MSEFSSNYWDYLKASQEAKDAGLKAAGYTIIEINPTMPPNVDPGEYERINSILRLLRWSQQQYNIKFGVFCPELTDLQMTLKSKLNQPVS